MEKKFEMNLLNAEEMQELHGGSPLCIMFVPPPQPPPQQETRVPGNCVLFVIPTSTVSQQSFVTPINEDTFLSSGTLLLSEKLSL